MSKQRLKAPKQSSDALLQLAPTDTRDTPHPLGTAHPRLAGMPLNRRRPSTGLKGTRSNPKPVLQLGEQEGDVGTWGLPAEQAWTPTPRSHLPTLAGTAVLPSTALTPPKPTQGQAPAPSPIPPVWEAAGETPPTPSHGRTPSGHRRDPGNQKETEFAQDGKQLGAHHSQSDPQRRSPPSPSHQDPVP